jgi:hypothetical protein
MRRHGWRTCHGDRLSNSRPIHEKIYQISLRNGAEAG